MLKFKLYTPATKTFFFFSVWIWIVEIDQATKDKKNVVNYTVL